LEPRFKTRLERLRRLTKGDKRDSSPSHTIIEFLRRLISRYERFTRLAKGDKIDPDPIEL